MVHNFFLHKQYETWEPPGVYNQIELDLGCGKGGFTCDLAARYPERLVIACDILAGRVHRVERKLERRKLENTQLFVSTAWELIGILLPDKCLDRVHILCPDPWPKSKHEARRLLCSEFLGRLAAKLKPNGVFHFSTDDEPYFDFVHEAIAELPMYHADHNGIADIVDLKTDFERLWHSKGKAVRHVAWRVV